METATKERRILHLYDADDTAIQVWGTDLVTGYHTDARYAELETLEEMREYARLNDAIKILTERRDTLRPKIAEALVAEVENGEKVTIGGHRFTLQRRRNYDAKKIANERIEFCIAGHKIETTLGEVTSETKRLLQYLKRDEYQTEGSFVVKVEAAE